MSKKLTWGIAFFISLGVMLAFYGMMDFQFFKHEMNEQNQLVIHDGVGEPIIVTNQDVTIDYDNLEVLGQYMETFNNSLLLGILIAALFIATYWMLLSDKWNRKEKRKRKKYLYWTLALNGLVIAVGIVLFIRYANLMNDAFYNVLF
jgi:uncharacterized membrane protein YidH (DUF202 family)